MTQHPHAFPDPGLRGLPEESIFVVQCVFGLFAGRIGLAAEQDGRWISKLGSGHGFTDCGRDKFNIICNLAQMREVLSLLD